MNHPDNLMYTSEHEWVKIEDNIATVGITDFAQGELGDIIFLENVNSSPYDSGWMVKIELSTDSSTSSLLDSKSYVEMIG